MPEYEPGALIALQKKMHEQILKELQSRGYRAANVLRNHTQKVLSGSRSGKSYRIRGSGGYYVASAPGEPPASPTGRFRNSFTAESRRIPNGVQAMAKSTYTVNGYVLGNLLEDGTSKMAPRPMHDKVIEESKSEVSEIFCSPYL